MEAIKPQYPDLSTLNSIIAALSTKLDSTEILVSGCEVLAQMFDTPRTSAWLVNEAGDAIEFAARYNLLTSDKTEAVNGYRRGLLGSLEFRGDQIPIHENEFLEQFYENKEVELISDVAHDRRFFNQRRALAHGKVGAVLLVPILFEDETVGIFELTHQEARFFHEEEQTLARNVADSVSTSLMTGKDYLRLQTYADYLDNALAQRTLELKSERDRTRSILEALGEAVFVTDLDGRIEYVNPAALHLTGYDREELIGKRMRLWRSQRQTAELYTQVLHTIQDGHTWRGEVINERKDGALYDAAMTVAPLFDPNQTNRTVGFVSVQRDITPIKEAENIKDQFVSNVSHELRTPVSVITLLVGNLHSLYDRLPDDKRRKLINGIRDHTQVLNDLISSVLEISRIDSDLAAPEMLSVDVAAILHEEAEKQAPLARSKNIHITVYAKTSQEVRGNEGQLRQVIRNLLNNAIKYSHDEGTIQLDCQRFESDDRSQIGWPDLGHLPEGDWVGFKVADLGMGIHKDDLPHLFERFYRVKSQGNVPGAGLGLSIAKDLVELHAGQIGVSSEIGHGSTFAVYLPALE